MISALSQFHYIRRTTETQKKPKNQCLERVANSDLSVWAGEGRSTTVTGKCIICCCYFPPNGINRKWSYVNLKELSGSGCRLFQEIRA
jgi:hypothetical protein